MIRIYLDVDFVVGKTFEISKDEFHYMTKVRRGQGEVEVFNQKGEIAKGRFEKSRFVVESIKKNLCPSFDITLALAVPDRDTLTAAIRGISELGLKKIILFPSERSQSPKNTEKSIDKLKRAAIESMRQCGRAFPLEIDWCARFADLKKITADLVLFMDESEQNFRRQNQAKARSLLVVIGPEGGWTQQERDLAKSFEWNIMHFPTPILKVSTACIAAGFYAISRVADLS